jgi:hypothetical protein
MSILQNKYKVSFLLLLITFVFSQGCTHIVTVNDRLSYEAIKQYRTQYEKQDKIKITLKGGSKDIYITKRPSGLMGHGLKKVFPVGRTFTAYVEQAVYEVFTEECIGPISVTLAIEECELSYTNSAAAAWCSMRNAIDMFEINLTIIADYSSLSKKTYDLHSKVDLPISIMANPTQEDLAITSAFEEITQQLVQYMIKDLKEGRVVSR